MQFLEQLRLLPHQSLSFHDALRAKGTKVAIIHFEAPDESTDGNLGTHIDAARISTRAKLKTFRDLGVEPIDILKPWNMTKQEFIQTISALNEDLGQVAPEKDLDTVTCSLR